jgi:hypothetical protein
MVGASVNPAAVGVFAPPLLSAGFVAEPGDAVSAAKSGATSGRDQNARSDSGAWNRTRFSSRFLLSWAAR